MTCFGDFLVSAAKADLGSPTDFGLPGIFCSLAVQTWMRRAANASGLPQPISGSPGAKVTMDQFKQAGTWLPVDYVRQNPEVLASGMVAVWHRGDPGSCTGHIGVVESGVSSDGTFGTIEANAAPTVSQFRRRLDAGELIGFGYFKDCNVQLAKKSGSLLIPVVLGAGLIAGAWLFTRRLR